MRLQFDAAECGAVCLGIVLEYHGRWVRPQELRDACGVGRDGSNAGDIARAGERYGLRVRGWRRQPAWLRKMRPPRHPVLGIQSLPRAGGLRAGPLLT